MMMKTVTRMTKMTSTILKTLLMRNRERTNNFPLMKFSAQASSTYMKNADIRLMTYNKSDSRPNANKTNICRLSKSIILFL